MPNTPKSFYRFAAFALIFCFLSGSLFAQSNRLEPQIAALPAIMMLLEDNQIRLIVGQQYTTSYSSAAYPNGITFSLDRLRGEVEVAIDLSGISANSSVGIYLNGILVREATNGTNTFLVPASALQENLIEIRPTGSNASWQISHISVSLTEGAPRTRAEAQRFLMRATFGPNLTELDRVMEVGYEAWVDEQVRLPRSNSLADFNAHFEVLKNRIATDVRNTGVTPECSRRNISDIDECIDLMHAILKGSGASRTRMDQWWKRTIRNQDQLRQRVVYGLSQILVTSVELGNALRGRNRAAVVYEDILSKHAFGNYRDLLKDVTLNPAMAYYLSFVGNQKAGRFGQPDENYAREIMQLFSIGLVELNIDGTPRLDANGNEIETYGPEEIQNLSRIFTGWIYSPGRFEFETWDLEPLVVWGNGNFHDSDQKIFMGRTHPPGLSQEQDLDMALDSIFNHANVGPFIAKRLIERLVMSNPSPAYVARVARKFNNNGSGVRGDMSEVVKAIVLDPEAFNSVNLPQGGKVKEPIVAVAQLWRAFNAQSDIADIRYLLPHADLGQRPYDAPTVFNFYAPTDAPADVARLGLVAPEMTLFKDDIVLNYIRRMYEFAVSGTVGNDPVTQNAPYSSDRRRAMILNLSEAKLVANNSDALLDFYSERLFGGVMSDHLRRVTSEFLAGLPTQSTDDENRQYRAEQALTVLLVSPEYNIQR